MVGESETQNDYDEEWENLLDSGILEDLIQKAEQENAAKRASQVVPSYPPLQSQPPPLYLPINTQTSALQPSCISTAAPPAPTFLNSQQIPIRPPFHSENVLNSRPPASSQSFKKPPLPIELKDSHSHAAVDPSQRSALQTLGPLRLGSTSNGNVNPRIQLSNGGFGLPKDEVRNVNELLAEKDGAIALLRSKLSHADSELYEFKKRSGAQNSSQQVPQLQQRELERLSLELSFKDQEVLDARRARDEKEDRLRDALDTAAALQEELESLRRLRAAEAAGNKRRRELGAETDAVNRSIPCGPQDQTWEHNKASLEGSHAHEKTEARGPPPDEAMWAAPWETEKPSIVPPSGKHNVVSCMAVVPGEPSDAAVLKARTVDDGCVTMSGKTTKFEALQAFELPSRQPATARSATSDPTIQPVRPGRGSGLDIGSSTSELTHSLQQIWNSKGARDEGVALVSEIFAVCRHELYILLTYEGSLTDVSKQLGRRTSSSKSVLGLKRKEALNNQSKKETLEGVGSKLHNALANVVNKLTPPTALIGPLLEYCNSSNMELVRSGLHVLCCILRHDSSCREKVIAMRGNLEYFNSKQAGISESLSRLNFRHEGKGWFIPSSGSDSKEQILVPVFSSPRVVCRVSVPQKEATTSTATHEQSEQGTDTGGEKEASPGLCNEGLLQQGTRDMNPFEEWLLDLAIRSSSSGIRFEATAIIGLLVAHSEPSVERAQFGPLLWGGGLVSLLKEVAGVGVQLQAVRLLHLLLHSPLLLQSFCSAQESTNGGRKRTARPDEGEPKEAVTVDFQPEWQRKGKQRAVLDALASCLAYTGSSLQEYALRRNAIRVLAFLAASGDSATTTLMCTHLNLMEQSGAPEKANNGGEGVMCQQSEHPTEGPDGPLLVNAENGHARPPGDSSHTEGGDRERIVVTGGEQRCSIPWRLISLLAHELNAEEDDEMTSDSDKLGCAEDRACLIRETLTLLCKLASHATHSGTVLALLTSTKEASRLVLGATNQLITRGSRARPGANLSADLVELARGLQKRVVVELAEYQ